MSGLAFGLVLGVSGSYHLSASRGCATVKSVQFVRPRVRPAPPAMAIPPCQMAAPAGGMMLVEFGPNVDPPSIDTQADQMLAQARALAHSNPQEARQLCRQAMKLYNNNPRNARVRTAFRLLNTIAQHDDDDE